MTIGRSDRRNAVTGITGYPCTGYGRAGMIGEGIEETSRRMTGDAFRVGNRVGARRSVSRSRGLDDGRIAIVTARAAAGDTRMVKVAIAPQLEETDGIVAAIAFGVGWQMKHGLADGLVSVVTLAAIAKYFLMIDKRSNGPAQGCVVGFANISGGQMIL